MDAVDLDDATTELYALTPAGFTARRSELASQAQREGQKDLAQEISELRRPTVAAWLVNQLARGAGGADEEIQKLEELGADLRAAQAEFDGPRLKELAKQRQQLVATLIRRAGAVGDEGGQKVSAGVKRELEETFGAAVADERASLAVLSGRLTRALVYAGFGEIDVTEATATPVTERRRRLGATTKSPSEANDPPHTPLHRRPSGDSATDLRHRRPVRRPAGTDDTSGSSGGGSSDTVDLAAEREREAAAVARPAAEEAAELAQADESDAAADLQAAAQHRHEVREQEARLTEMLTSLQREIVRVRHELDDLTRTIAAADRDHQRRQRQLDQARKAVRQAESALDQEEG